MSPVPPLQFRTAIPEDMSAVPGLQVKGASHVDSSKTAMMLAFRTATPEDMSAVPELQVTGSRYVDSSNQAVMLAFRTVTECTEDHRGVTEEHALATSSVQSHKSLF